MNKTEIRAAHAAHKDGARSILPPHKIPYAHSRMVNTSQEVEALIDF